jgi:multiple sugar transport system substrate-binding protein
MDRRTFLGSSILFAGGVALSGCTDDPQKKGGGAAVTLNQWYHAYGEQGTQEAAKRYAAEYTKANPNIAVKVTWVPGEYETKLNSALLTADAPDVFELGNFRYQLIKNGQLAPLDDVLGGDRADFSRTALDVVTSDSKTYGIKMIDDVMMLYYRKSLLSQAGIAPPQTFTELAAAAGKLTTSTRKGLFVGNDGVGDSPYLLLWSGGGDLIDGRAVAFHRPAGAAAIGGLRQLHDSKVLLLDFTTDWYDPGAIIQSAAAMHWCGLWAMPAIRKAIGDDFGVVPWPSFGASGVPAARLGGWYELVNAKSQHVEEAKKYVQWLWVRQSDYQKDWSLKYGFHVPARSSIAGQATELTTGAAKEALTISQRYGKSYPSLWNTAMRTAFLDAAAKIAKQGADPMTTLAGAATTCQAELDNQLR